MIHLIIDIKEVGGKLFCQPTARQASQICRSLKELQDSLPLWIAGEDRCNSCTHWGDHSFDQGMRCPRTSGIEKYNLEITGNYIMLDKNDPSCYRINLGPNKKQKLIFLKEHWDDFITQLSSSLEADERILYEVNPMLASKREIMDIAAFMERGIRAGYVTIKNKHY